LKIGLATAVLLAVPALARADELGTSEEPARLEVGLEAHLAVLHGDARRLFRSPLGFGILVFGEREVASFVQCKLYLGGEFSYDRVSESVIVRVPQENNTVVQYEDTQQLTHSAFVFGGHVRRTFGPITAFAGGGGGFSIAHFLRPYDGGNPAVERNSTVPLLRVRAGAEYGVGHAAFGLAFAYTWAFSDDTVMVPMLATPVQPFGDWITIGAGVSYRF
jgi:hypothetical protein